MAAIADPKHVKAVFAEGLPSQGLGLPEKFSVPVYLAYGEEDNYGTDPRKNEMQWSRSGLCRENTPFGDLSNRNSLECNAEKNRDNPIETVEEWFKRVSSNGQPIHLKFYKDAAHVFF